VAHTVFEKKVQTRRKRALLLLTYILFMVFGNLSYALDIISISNENLDVDKADIRVVTDNTSRVSIQYGLNSANMTTSQWSESGKEHIISLRDLKWAAVYHYSVIVKTEHDEQISSGDNLLRLKKTSNSIPIPVIESVSINDVTATSATIKVNVDRPSRLFIRYRHGSRYVTETTDFTYSYEFNLDQLAAGKVYHFHVVAEGENGQIIKDRDRLLRLSSKTYKTRVQITHLSVIERGDESATLSWRTNKPTTGMVKYGLTEDLEEDSITLPLAKEHQVTINNLNNDTHYFYRVEANVDPKDTIQSKMQSFDTLDSQEGEPTIIEVDNGYLTEDGLTGFVKITTSEDTKVWIDYGFNHERTYQSAISDFNSTHGIALPYFRAERTYHYNINIEDADGNIFRSKRRSIKYDEVTVISDAVITTLKGHTINSNPAEEIRLCKKFDIGSIRANSKVRLNCLLDLNGLSYQLPPNVNLLSYGGDIINGTLIFAGGKIDGKLLNSSIHIGGDVHLSNANFVFDNQRWGVVEGIVNNEQAKENTRLFQYALNQAHNVHANVFRINKFDASFWVGNYKKFNSTELSGITLPSNIKLSMRHDTILRTQANGYARYALLGLYNADNVTIEGGVLIGDRDTHDYKDPQSPKPYWGHLMKIGGSRNVTIKGVTFKNATADGLSIHSLGTYKRTGSIETKNILVTDCLFDNNRRLGTAITSGSEIIVEHNTYLNSGQPSEASESVSPAWAIDIEGGYKDHEYLERPYNITIRNNIERNSYRGAFIGAIGDGITIENNNTENTIALGSVFNSKAFNNTITRDLNKEYLNPNGLSVAYDGEKMFYPTEEVVGNNEVYNNKLIGARMYISGSGNSIFNNSISNSLTGITIQKAKNAEIYNNTVHSNVENSIGLSARDSINNVNVYDNDFNIEGLAIRFISINEKLGHENFSMYLNNNRFTSSGYNKAASVSRSRNVYFNENNFSNIGFIMYTSDNIQLIGNRVETKTRIGLQIEEGNEQIKLHDNLVIHPEKKKCIRNLSEQIPDIKNNVCMGI